MFRRAMFVLVVLAIAPLNAADPQQIPLWPNGAPGFEDRKDEPEQAQDYWVRNIHNPSITVFLPPADKATGAAVLVCPGGGHRELVFNAEGREAAEYLNSIGVAAFALKYRLGRETDSPYSVAEHPRQDALRAIRTIRHRADEWGVDPARVGMLGFSAGGEVVAMTAYQPTDGDANAADPVDQRSGRPDFVMFVYPGPQGIPQSFAGDVPPAFLIVANDDRGAAGSIVRLLNLYRDANVPVETHIFARGGHAFNMGRRARLVSLQHWPARMADWMADNYILDPSLRDEEARREQAAEAERQRQREQQLEQRNAARQQRIESATTIHDPTGTWTWERAFGGNRRSYTLRLGREGDQVTGSYSVSVDGELSNDEVAIKDVQHVANELTFRVLLRFNDREFPVTYSGTIDEDEITGHYEMNFGGELREFEWKATKVAAVE